MFRQSDEAFGTKTTTASNEEAAKDVEPLLSESAGGVTLERVDADRAEDQAINVPRPPTRTNERLRGFVEPFRWVNNSDLGHVESAAEPGENRGQDEYEELETGSGVTGEKDAVLAIANGALNEAEFRWR